MMPYASGASAKCDMVAGPTTKLTKKNRAFIIGGQRQSIAIARLFCVNYYLVLIVLSLLASRDLADNGSAWPVLAQETKGGPSLSSSSSFSSSSNSVAFEGAKGQPKVGSKFRENILSIKRRQQAVQQPVVQQKVLGQTVEDVSQELIANQKVEQFRQQQQQQQQQQRVEQQQVVSLNRVDNSVQQQRESIIESQQQLQQQQQQSEASAEPTVFGSINGSPGVDFPAYTSIPNTKFSCYGAPFDPGMYADESTACQVYHICYQGRRESFLCGVGTVFNQAIMSCDFWHSVECSKSSQYYNLNADFGKSSSEPSAGTSQNVATTATTATSTRNQVLSTASLARLAPRITDSFSTKSIQQSRQQAIQQYKPLVPVAPPPPPSVVSNSFREATSISSASSSSRTGGGGGGGKTSVRNFDLQQAFNSQRTSGGAVGAPFVSPSRRAAAQREEQLRRRMGTQFASESSPMEFIATSNATGEPLSSVSMPVGSGIKSRSASKSIETSVGANRRVVDSATLNGLAQTSNDDSRKQPAATTGSLSFGQSSSLNGQDQVWKPYFKSKTRSSSAKPVPPPLAQSRPTPTIPPTTTTTTTIATPAPTSSSQGPDLQADQEPKFSLGGQETTSSVPTTESPAPPSERDEKEEAQEEKRNTPTGVASSPAPPPPPPTATVSTSGSDKLSPQAAIESDVNPAVSSTAPSVVSGSTASTSTSITPTTTTTTTTTTPTSESTEQTSPAPSTSSTSPAPTTSVSNEDDGDAGHDSKAGSVKTTTVAPPVTPVPASEDEGENRESKKKRNSIELDVSNASSVEYAN